MAPSRTHSGNTFTVSVIQHNSFTGLGTMEPVLKQKEFDVKIYEVDHEGDALKPLLENPLEPDLLIVLGGVTGAYEMEQHPFIQKEAEIIRARINEDRPTLGSCFGAQLMAMAAGSKVYPGKEIGKDKEIGWLPLQLTPEGRESIVDCFADEGVTVPIWHGDTFDLPPQATLLASTDLYPNQIFQIGDNCLGFQPHLEVTGAVFCDWIDRLPSKDPDALRRATSLHAPRSEEVATKFWARWLDAVVCFSQIAEINSVSSTTA